MGKAEIMQELARLTPQELAEVRAHLDRLEGDNGASGKLKGAPGIARIRSPRLADPSIARDFVKQVLPASR